MLVSLRGGIACCIEGNRVSVLELHVRDALPFFAIPVVTKGKSEFGRIGSWDSRPVDIRTSKDHPVVATAADQNVSRSGAVIACAGTTGTSHRIIGGGADIEGVFSISADHEIVAGTAVEDAGGGIGGIEGVGVPQRVVGRAVGSRDGPVLAGGGGSGTVVHHAHRYGVGVAVDAVGLAVCVVLNRKDYVVEAVGRAADEDITASACSRRVAVTARRDAVTAGAADKGVADKGVASAIGVVDEVVKPVPHAELPAIDEEELVDELALINDCVAELDLSQGRDDQIMLASVE